jgi:hypothetical protein
MTPSRRKPRCHRGPIVLAFGTDIDIELSDLGRRELPETVVIVGAGADVGTEIADPLAVLERELARAKRPALSLRFTALEVEPVLHIDDERATDRVESIDGIGGNDVDPVDG